MSWVFRKIFRFGPFRTTLSKSGMGVSWGIPGFRFGVSPSGRKYVSFGLPGTGIYFIKYLSPTVSQNHAPDTFNTANNNSKSSSRATKSGEPWWKQKNL